MFTHDDKLSSLPIDIDRAVGIQSGDIGPGCGGFPVGPVFADWATSRGAAVAATAGTPAATGTGVRATQAANATGPDSAKSSADTISTERLGLILAFYNHRGP